MPDDNQNNNTANNSVEDSGIPTSQKAINESNAAMDASEKFLSPDTVAANNTIQNALAEAQARIAALEAELAKQAPQQAPSAPQQEAPSPSDIASSASNGTATNDAPVNEAPADQPTATAPAAPVAAEPTATAPAAPESQGQPMFNDDGTPMIDPETGQQIYAMPEPTVTAPAAPTAEEPTVTPPAQDAAPLDPFDPFAGENNANPATPADPAETTPPAQDAAPLDPFDPFAGGENPDPVTPADPVEPTPPAQDAAPLDPFDPFAGGENPDPVTPADPVEPTPPAQDAAPADDNNQGEGNDEDEEEKGKNEQQPPVIAAPSPEAPAEGAEYDPNAEFEQMERDQDASASPVFGEDEAAKGEAAPAVDPFGSSAPVVDEQAVLIEKMHDTMVRASEYPNDDDAQKEFNAAYKAAWDNFQASKKDGDNKVMEGSETEAFRAKYDDVISKRDHLEKGVAASKAVEMYNVLTNKAATEVADDIDDGKDIQATVDKYRGSLDKNNDGVADNKQMLAAALEREGMSPEQAQEKLKMIDAALKGVNTEVAKGGVHVDGEKVAVAAQSGPGKGAGQESSIGGGVA